MYTVIDNTMQLTPNQTTAAQHKGYEMLELYEAKVSRTVLRGERRSYPPDLPDNDALWREAH